MSGNEQDRIEYSDSLHSSAMQQLEKAYDSLPNAKGMLSLGAGGAALGAQLYNNPALTISGVITIVGVSTGASLVTKKALNPFEEEKKSGGNLKELGEDLGGLSTSIVYLGAALGYEAASIFFGTKEADELALAGIPNVEIDMVDVFQ